MKKIVLSVMFMLGFGICAMAQVGEATKRCQTDYGSGYVAEPASNNDYHGVIRHEEKNGIETRTQSFEGTGSGEAVFKKIVDVKVEGKYDSGHDNKSQESRNGGESYYKCVVPKGTDK